MGKPVEEIVKHLPEHDLILWCFPCDPALTQLGKLIEPERAKNYLPYTQLPAEVRGPGDIQYLDLSIIGYRPEQRCTIRYALHYRQEHQPKLITLYGKCFQGDEGQRIFTRMCELWEYSRKHPDSLHIAQPLGYNATVKTIWQQGIEGLPLLNVLDTANSNKYLAITARGLASLHQSTLTAPATLTPAEYYDDIAKKIAKLTQAFPELTTRLQRLSQRLEGDLPKLDEYETQLIYGDFHLRQLRVHNNSVYFFDFDEFAMGDATQDLAQLLVDLRLYRFADAEIVAMSAAFLSAYAKAIDKPISYSRILWHARAQLINKAYRFYKQQIPDLRSNIYQVLSFEDGLTAILGR